MFQELQGLFEKKKVINPCQKEMDLYLACVDGQKEGLSEGNECMKETNLYKACRASNKNPPKPGTSS